MSLVALTLLDGSAVSLEADDVDATAAIAAAQTPVAPATRVFMNDGTSYAVQGTKAAVDAIIAAGITPGGVESVSVVAPITDTGTATDPIIGLDAAYVPGLIAAALATLARSTTQLWGQTSPAQTRYMNGYVAALGSAVPLRNQTPARRLKRMRVWCAANTLATTASTTITVMKNNVATAIAVTYAAAATGAMTSAANVDFAAGDDWDVMIVTAAGTGTSANFAVTLEWDPILP